MQGPQGVMRDAGGDGTAGDGRVTRDDGAAGDHGAAGDDGAAGDEIGQLGHSSGGPVITLH